MSMKAHRIIGGVFYDAPWKLKPLLSDCVFRLIPFVAFLSAINFTIQFLGDLQAFSAVAPVYSLFIYLPI